MKSARPITCQQNAAIFDTLAALRVGDLGEEHGAPPTPAPRAACCLRGERRRVHHEHLARGGRRLADDVEMPRLIVIS
ncbi:MAG: hypothetical protein U0Q04_00835 [Microbacterium sp.]